MIISGPCEISKIPWVVDDTTSPSRIWIMDADGQEIASVRIPTSFHGEVQKIDRNNAEFIVRACNSYDSLLNICKILLTQIGEKTVSSDWGSVYYNPIIHPLQKEMLVLAIKKAEEI